MKCPKCVDRVLDQRMGPSGVLVDICAACGGIWLDKGDVYHYVRDAKRLYADFAAAAKSALPSPRQCPRCPVALLEARFPAPGPAVDACPKCSGTWFDAGQLDALNAMLDKEIASAALSSRPAAAPAAAAALAVLPSLALRSAVVISSLYALLAAFAFVAARLLKFGVGFAFASASLAIVLQFLLSPFLMDLSLRWLHDFRWVDPADLPAGLRGFVNGVCRERGIPFPRCGIIADENPNAFTYGHFPGDARFVLTQGILTMLSEDEVEAVAGHELGHIVHWDMLVMTAAALVPLVLYGVYRFCMRVKSRKNNPFPAIGLAALVLYFATEYVVLFLSRTRELYADRFSGEVTRKPNDLSRALVKIAYGLAGHRQGDEEGSGSAEAQAARTLGIFDPVGAQALVAASLSPSGGPSMDNILGAMQWDLWNPWAKYYELNSTHPLPAHRIELLGRQAAAYGQTPFVNFDLKPPENYWDEFLVDLGALWLPYLLAGGFLFAASRAGHPWPQPLWHAAIGWGLGNFVRLWFSYGADSYPEMTIGSLLKRVKVSRVRGIPATIKGKVIGRGIPGYIVSEDIVIQDQTGFLFVDYRQPLAIFQWIFALGRVPQLIGCDVTLRGWYRRAPVPYLELRAINDGATTNVCYGLEGQLAFTILVILAAVHMLGVF